MLRHRALIVLALLFALVVGATFAFLPLQQVRAQTGLTVPVIPDYVAYKQLFRHVLALKKVADQAASAGQDRSSLRSLVSSQAGLNEADGQLLETAAVQCGAELDAQAAKAKVILDEIHARTPYGILNPSFPPPAPDPRLHEMQQERNSMVLLCRDQLRNALGEESFAKLDTWLKNKSAARNISYGVRPFAKQQQRAPRQRTAR